MRRYDFFNKRRVTLQDMNDMQNWIGQDIRNYLGVHCEKGILRQSEIGLGDGYGNPRYSKGVTFDITVAHNAGGTVYNIPLPTPGIDAIYFIDRAGHFFGIYDNVNYIASPTVFQNTGNLNIPLTSAVGGGGDGDYYVWASYKDLEEQLYIKQDKSGGTHYPKRYEGYTITTIFNNSAQPPFDCVFCGKITKVGTTLTADYTGQVFAGIKQDDINIFVEVSHRPATYANLEHKSLREHIDAIGHGVVYNTTFTSPYNPHGIHPDDMANINSHQDNVEPHTIVNHHLSRLSDSGGPAVQQDNVKLTDSGDGSALNAETIPYGHTSLHPTIAEQMVFNTPVGSVTMWAGRDAPLPVNWAICNGTAVLKSTYPVLFTAIGNHWGIPKDDTGAILDANLYFKLPDLRGMFIRGAYSNISGRQPYDGGDPSSDRSSRKDFDGATPSGFDYNQPGSYEHSSTSVSSHTHEVKTKKRGFTGDQNGSGDGPTGRGTHDHKTSSGTNVFAAECRTFNGNANNPSIYDYDVTITSETSSTVTDETRPVNAYLYYIIRVA